MKISSIGIILALTLLTACAGQEFKPVEISDGELCTFCKMAVSERRYAAQLLNEDGEAFLFDDIGCMRRYVDETRFRPAAVFVIDFDSKEWLDGKKAFYVRSQEFQTPMGGQTAAYRSDDDARAAVKKYGGELTRLW